MQIVRSTQEIEGLLARAQQVSFAAEDEGERDHFADGVYQTLQWLAGNDDIPEVGTL